VKYPVDGGGRDIEAMLLVEEELDLVLADPGLGFFAVIGPQVGNQLLVLWGSLVGTAMRSSGEIPQAPLALLSEPLDPLEDCRAGGAEGPGGFRDVLLMGKEELDHRPTVALGLGSFESLSRS
jgi:hypothetical protein